MAREWTTIIANKEAEIRKMGLSSSFLESIEQSFITAYNAGLQDVLDSLPDGMSEMVGKERSEGWNAYKKNAIDNISKLRK